MKKIFNQVPTLTQKQIKEQAQMLVKFLRLVYPFLDDDEWNDGAIELRPLKRDKNAKMKYIKSFNAWHLKDKDILALEKFLSMLNGNGYCVYFAGFAMDFHKEVLKKNGKPYIKGKINNKNALFTCILAADFDKISFEEFLKEKQVYTDLGIETVDIFTGHGYQSFILLNVRVYDKDIFKKFTELMYAKGFKVDQAIVDAARLLRPPRMFNCKALDPAYVDYYDELNPEIFETEVIAWTDKRYDVTDIFRKLQSLPDVIRQSQSEVLTEIDLIEIPTTDIHVVAEKRKEAIEAEAIALAEIAGVKDAYTMINLDKLPLPVQKMLTYGTPAGHSLGNQVLLFLVPFFKNTECLPIGVIKEIMTVWAKISKRDVQSVVSDVNSLYKNGFKGKHGKYTSALAKTYGYHKFENMTRDNKIKIMNSIFEHFNTMSDGSIRIYLSMILAEKTKDMKIFTKEDIQHVANISGITFIRHIKDLVVIGNGEFVGKRLGNRRKGEGYTYALNQHYSAGDGFTLLDVSFVMSLLDRLTDGEIKLYLYLCFLSGQGGKSWPSQKTLAKLIGKSGHNSISMMTDSLVEKGFITKTTTENGYIMNCTYNLNV